VHRNRARLLLQRGDDPAALQDLETAIRLESPEIAGGPSLAAAQADDYLERGRILRRAGKPRDALRSYQAALRLAPEDPRGHRLRADVLMELGNFEEALQALDCCLRQDPADAVLYRTRGLIYSELGNHPRALQDYTRALELQPDAPTHAVRGWAYLLVHDAPRLALRDFEEALHLDPKQGDAHCGRGLAFVQLGQWSKGVADADQALTLGPSSPRLTYNAARVYALAASQADMAQRRGYQDRAIQLLERALQQQSRAVRTAFWHKVVTTDRAWKLLQRHPGFVRLVGAFGQENR
jgi:tetratricopeptide (TPR) repeat protein